MTRTNEYGQPIGDALLGWTCRPYPEDVTLTGRTCRVEALDAKHYNDLYEAFSSASDDRDWTYLSVSTPKNTNELRNYIESRAKLSFRKYYAIVDLKSCNAVGFFSLLRIDPENGSIAIGNVTFSPLLKQTVSSTEAQYLLMRYVFEELGYRRYEWRCNVLNEPSKNAAQRLGFEFEGVMRNLRVTNSCLEDSALYSIIDIEWPRAKKDLEAWLDQSNFDSQGKQIKSLLAIREENCIQI